MSEGSVVVDEGGLPSMTAGDDASQDDNQDAGSDNGADNHENDGGEGEDGGVKYTEKGTKVDPNPLSAAHQLLANADKKIAAYEKVLGDPELLKKYARESGMTLAEAKAEIKDDIKEYTPDRFQKAQDVADVLNEIRRESTKTIGELKAEIAELRNGQAGMTEQARSQQIVSNLSKDMSEIQEKYPELNPKSPEYNHDLEEELGTLYSELDLDPKTGKAMGKVSLVRLAERLMKAAGIAQRKGSERAQTQVVSKQAGRIVTAGKGQNTREGDNASAGTTIAQRIAKAMGN